MPSPGNGFVGRMARGSAARTAFFIPPAALSGAPVTLLATPPADTRTCGFQRLTQGVGAAILMALLSAACGVPTLKPSLIDPAQAPEHARGAPALKVHLTSGDLCLLESWHVDADGRTLTGQGTRYSAQREVLATGEQTIPMAEVALFETNERAGALSGGSFGVGVLTTAWSLVSAACVANPKSCFGSCPTFYLDGDPDLPRAEGFSGSVLRALEATDVDALPTAVVRGPLFSLTMRNEALETHWVRSLRLRVAPRPPGGRVMASGDGRFFTAFDPRPPLQCRGPEGDCLAAVSEADHVERRSEADSADLAARETIDVTFAPVQGRVGLAVTARQGLVTTFVFYQTLAHLGRSAGEWVAQLERGGPARAREAMTMARLLGGIEVETAADDGSWRPVGHFDEAGPIASDRQVLPFEAAGGPVRLRLTMSKGNWGIDQLALVRLGPEVVARAVEPERVERDGRPAAAALAALRAPDRYLVTEPGDAYRISFRLTPDESSPELFLESRGYYYEWMRGEWLAEEDAALAGLCFARPDLCLRRLAGPYKAQERGAEEAFWRSRFGRSM